MKQGEVIQARFRVEALAGKGGMGYVYRCIDLSNQTPVAVKILTRVSEDSQKRFSQEASILSSLHHPGVVRYVAHGYHAGVPYLAMEWLSGESLSQRLSRSPLKVSEALDIARHCALALAPVHQVGVIHRDIKPSNIFLLNQDTNQIKLLDFGIARLSAKEADMTKTGLLLGSPGYLAPEQARGDKRLTTSADIFALGSVLFECLAGRPPFVAAHSIAVLVKVLFEDVPRLREFRPMLPESLEALIAKMLSKNPADRYPDGASVASALEQLEAFDEQATSMAASLIPTTITQQEQRLLGVILLSGVFQPSSFHTTSATGDIPTLSFSKEEAATHASDDQNVMNDASRLLMLRELVARFGARAEPLADGSMVVSVAGQGEAIDQAAQAARCAIELHRALPKAPIALSLGIGALSPSPFGAVVDRAASLLEKAPHTKPTVFIDDATAALLEQRFHIKRLSQSILLEAERANESSARTLLGRPSPFIGREREVRLILEKFNDCVETSSPRLLLITAPAGIGKSRLRAECSSKLSALCLLAKGDVMSVGAPFSMLARAFRSAAVVQDTDSPEERFRKVAAFVTRRLDTVTKQETYSQSRRLAEFLGELAQTPSTTPSTPLKTARQEPSLMGDQIRRAFLDWISIECKQQPLALFLEDLHWGDSASIQLLTSALHFASYLPLFIIGLTRPEAKERLGALGEYPGLEEIILSPLSREDCRTFMKSTLGDRISIEKQDIAFNASQGNAFYLEELIRSMSAGYDALPASVIAMAQARIDNLPDAARHVLRAASVFGESFTLSALTPMLRGLVDERQLREQLRWLTRQEMLTPSAHQDQVQFRHALMREAAYAKLTPTDKASAHRFAAQWLESQAGAAPFVIAEHWRKGDEPALASTWYIKAAKAALDANDLRSVIQLTGLAEGLKVEENQRALLYHLRAEAYGWLGEPQKASELWEQYLEQVPHGSATWYNAHAALFMSSLQLRDFERSLAVIEQLQAVTPTPEALTESSMALAIVVSFACVGGLYQVAASFIEKFNRSVMPPSDAENWISLGWRNQAYAYGALYLEGDPWEYLQRAQAAMRYFEKAGHLRGAMTQAVEVGRAYLCLGAFPQAERFLREKLSQIESLQLHYVQPFAKLFLAQSLRSQQKYKEARSLIEEALQEFAKTNHGPKQGDSRAELGKVYVEQGELDDADTQLNKALQFLAFALPAKSKATAIYSLIRLAQNKPQEALDLSQEALDLLDGLGGKGYEDTYLYWAHTEALLANKKLREAKDFIYEAKRRIAQRADRITDFNFRESFVRNVEENRKLLSLAHQFQI
jgi:serine/threonine protein kinase/tetratricopeptide (TPR) repeat protein